MLYDNNILPLITIPTRITSHTTTLIDHVYSNCPTEKNTSGIVAVDISKHLPIFCMTTTQVKKSKIKKYRRDYPNFGQNKYVNKVNLINWDSIINSNDDLHTQAENFVQKICSCKTTV